MWARLSIVAGLVIGVAVAGLLLGGILAFVPDRPLPSAAAPSAPVATPAPSPSASAVASPSAVPSASVAAAAFRVGGIGPDVMVHGLETTLPGVDVQP